MTSERAREILEQTVGGTVPPEEVGIDTTEAEAFRLLIAADPELAAEAAALAATSRLLAKALAPRVGSLSDAELANRIVGAVPGGRLLRIWRPAVAAALIVAAGIVAWSLRPTDVGGDPSAVEQVVAYRLLPEPVPDYAGPRFENVTARSGIDAENHTGSGGQKDWMVEVVGHGAAVLDMDGDGDLDLFVPDGNRVSPASRVAGTWRLYRNDGSLHFVDVTNGSGLDTADAWAGGAVAADFDADGRPDLFVPCYGSNRLYRNLGGGRFEDVTDVAGVAGDAAEWSTAAAVGDIDGDGDLDLYVSNYADMRRFIVEEREGRSCTWREMAVPCGPEPLLPQRDRLFENRGDGTFVDATEARLPITRRYSFQPVISDFDDDGHLDVFVASDGHPNMLLLNDGTGRFADHALAAGVATDARGREQACMGVAVGDFDGDGLNDLFATNFSHEPNVLYRARPAAPGRPTYSDATSGAGLTTGSLMTLGWGTAMADLDADGDLDLAVANGHLYPDVGTALLGTAYEQHVSLLENDGGGRFREVSASAGDGVRKPRVHRGLVAADFDDDGRLDLFLTVLNGRSVLLRNDGRGTGGSIRLVLRRADGRTEAAGARVTATVGSRRLVRDHLIGSSFGSSEDPRLLIGLGKAESAKISVRWPARTGAAPVTESFGELAAGGVYELVEGSRAIRRIR